MTYNVFGGTLNLAQLNPPENKSNLILKFPLFYTVINHSADYSTYLQLSEKRNIFSHLTEPVIYWHDE